MKLFNFTIIKLTLCLVIGILLGYFLPLGLNASLFITSVFFFLFGIVFFSLKNSLKKPIWFGVLGFITMISVGMLNTSLHSDTQFANHYTKVISLEDSLNSTITFRVREVLKPSNYYNKYVIDILKIDSTAVIGKSLLNIAKDSTKQHLKVDEILIARTTFKVINPPLNPYQFDYRNYLKKQHIYHQLYITHSELFPISNSKHTLFGFAAKIREHIQAKLKQYPFSADEYAIINALLLGQRQDISKDIYNSYSQAGVIHILAVSGLHVGIILFLLEYLLRPIEYLKQGKYLKLSIIVILLWCFAIIAGLSASVTRAVTMFSIIAFAMHLNRPSNIYNTLAISMFVLLLFKPNFLFDVGFQMSYMAVLAIVIIQPMLYKLIKPKYKASNFFWNIFTVTLAAQFGVIPISLYYFHQFPGLFFVSNLVVIPFLEIILGFGIVIIVLASLSILPQFLANAYAFVIELMNHFVIWISHQEAFLFQNISFNLAQTVLSYLLMATVLFAITHKSHKSLRLLLISIIMVQMYFLYASKTNLNQAFIVFHKSRYTILGFKNNTALSIHHNLNDSVFNTDKTISAYKVGQAIKTIQFDTLQNVYQVDNRLLLVIDSLGIYKSLSFKPQFVLLRNSPKINLSRLIDSLQPELIISDGSNYKSYQNRWEVTCKAKKIPFHRTSEKGAFIYNF